VVVAVTVPPTSAREATTVATGAVGTVAVEAVAVAMVVVAVEVTNRAVCLFLVGFTPFLFLFSGFGLRVCPVTPSAVAECVTPSSPL
jgi:hypothetical protein